MDDDKLYDFDMAKSPQTIIKVIGVGGGGGNAVSIAKAFVTFRLSCVTPIIRRCKSRKFLTSC